MAELLPPPTPSVPVPLAGPGAARDRGRALRRRRVALMLGAGGTVGALALAVTLAGGPADRQTLVPTVEASLSATPESTGAATPAPSPRIASDPEPTPTPSAATSPEPEPSDGPRPTVTSSIEPSSEPSSEAAQSGSAMAGPVPTITTYDVAQQCDGSGPSTTQGWCSFYDGATTAARGSSAELAATVCRISGQGTGRLHANSGQYAEFAVGTNDTGALWRWSTGRTFTEGGHDFSVPAGSCLRWAVTWDLHGDDGAALPAGTYDLDAVPYVTNTGGYVSLKNVETFTIT